jgi:hypothetical protein
MKIIKILSIIPLFAYLQSCVMVAPLVAGVAAQAVVNNTNKTETSTEVMAEGDASAMQSRATQSKQIDATYKTSYKAIMDVLQDKGFTVDSTDYNTGLITASKKIPIRTTTSSQFGLFNKSKTSFRSFIYQKTTVTTEEWGKDSSRVRVLTDLDEGPGMGGNPMSATDKAKYLDKDNFYQDFFASLDKAIFIRRQNL